MSEKTTIARRGHYLTVPVAFVTEALLARLHENVAAIVVKPEIWARGH